MKYSPLAIKRRNILGDIYSKCELVEGIPVYLEDKDGEAVGHVDESLGRYADAFVFHLPEEVCKKLSTSGYEVFIDSNKPDERDRITLNHFILVSKKTPVAVPRRNAHLLTQDA